MRNRITVALGLTLLSLALAAGTALAAPPSGVGAPLSATLTGAEGGGTASFTLNPGAEELCYTIDSTGLVNVTNAHIHAFPVRPGNVVVGTAVNLSSSGDASACVHVAREVLLAILTNPGGYYLNVHTQTSPGGAIAGALTH
jgi:hypothetical protein